MKTIKQPVLLTKEDHNNILSYLRNHDVQNGADRNSAEALKAELKRARLLDADQLPPDVVRMGNRIKVRDTGTNTLMELMIVAPGDADWRKKRISVLSPLGTALIGFRRGVTVKWKMPAGIKKFLIEEVQNANLVEHS